MSLNGITPTLSPLLLLFFFLLLLFVCLSIELFFSLI